MPLPPSVCSTFPRVQDGRLWRRHRLAHSARFLLSSLPATDCLPPTPPPLPLPCNLPFSVTRLSFVRPPDPAGSSPSSISHNAPSFTFHFWRLFANHFRVWMTRSFSTQEAETERECEREGEEIRERARCLAQSCG